MVYFSKWARFLVTIVMPMCLYNCDAQSNAIISEIVLTAEEDLVSFVTESEDIYFLGKGNVLYKLLNGSLVIQGNIPAGYVIDEFYLNDKYIVTRYGDEWTGNIVVFTIEGFNKILKLENMKIGVFIPRDNILCCYPSDDFDGKYFCYDLENLSNDSIVIPGGNRIVYDDEYIYTYNYPIQNSSNTILSNFKLDNSKHAEIAIGGSYVHILKVFQDRFLTASKTTLSLVSHAGTLIKSWELACDYKPWAHVILKDNALIIYNWGKIHMGNKNFIKQTINLHSSM